MTTMTIEQRAEAFKKELQELSAKYQIDIRAVVNPVLQLMDIKPIEKTRLDDELEKVKEVEKNG